MATELDPDTKLLIALGVAGAGIVLAARLRGDVPSQLAMLLGYGIAQWLVSSAHDQRYPEVPLERSQRALQAHRDWVGG